MSTEPESRSWQSHINHSVLPLAHSNTSAKSLLAGRSQPVTPSPKLPKNQESAPNNDVTPQSVA